MTGRWVRAGRISFCALLLLGAGRAHADSNLDVEVANLLEFQVGRDPETEEDERTRFFDQLVLDAYTDRGLRFGLRLERFQDSPPPELFGGPTDEYEYDRVSQRFVEWSDGSTTLRLGSGYAIFGSGIVFRAFELPGVVRQTRFPVVGYAESRDLDGVVARTWQGPLELTMIHGTPVVSPDVPPEQSRTPRRAGSVSGVSGDGTVVDGVVVGGSYLRADGLEPGATSSMVEEVGAVRFQLEPFLWGEGWAPEGFTLRSSVEFAGRNWRPGADGFSTATGTPHALYTNTQLAWLNGALGVETKDYHLFRLAVSDPPSLVPEFSHPLLNRTTHVLDPVDEKGHQITLGQSLPNWLGGGSLEAIHARAEGRPPLPDGFGEARLYEQSFVAVESDPARDERLRLYFSDGRDQFDGLDEVRTVGALGSWALPDGWAVELDASHQVRERRGLDGSVRSEDVAVQGALSRASLGQVGFLWERTDDPLFLDDPFTPEIEEDPRHYLIGTVAWLIDERHDLVVSYGKRRGGTACTSGTCYFVPDFEGLELRVQSRF